MGVTLMSIAAAPLACLLFAATTAAQPHTVLPGESIQAAIDDAAPGETILVEAGRYNEAIDLRGKPITLRSIRGSRVTILDGAGLGDAVLRCVSGETPNTLVDGFTITGGAGSAEYAPSRGGGLLVRCSSPVIRNCVFEGNSAGDFGGGAYVIGETLELAHCPTSPTFENCRFLRNHAARGAGLSTYFADLRLEGCAFLGNQAGTEGGGLRTNGGTLTLLNSEFVANAANRGGALFLVNTSPGPASASIVGCTMTANQARIARGGAQIDIPATITNSILHADTAPEIFSFDPASTLVTHCLVQGGFPGAGNLASDPLFRQSPSAGPDAAWGTDDDDYGDLRLGAASPCIDRADGTAATLAGALNDASGCPRDVDDPGAPNAGEGYPSTIDLGAHEFRAPIVVDPSGAGDHTSIQAAINAAEPCDEVVLRPGTYNEPIDFLGKSITVRGGGPGAGDTLLSGAGLATSIVRFVSGEDARARLENVTVAGARGLCEGGGIRIVGSSPTIANCRVTDNISACAAADNWAAGIFIRGGAPAILDCEIDNNIVGNGGERATFGVGVYAEDAALFVAGCTFHDNITDNFFGDFSLGGGICHFGPLLCVEECTFTDNTVDSNGVEPGNGGAGLYSDAERLEVSGCEFSGNYAGENVFASGGGLWHTGEAALIEDCHFAQNHVGSGGGAYGMGGALALDAGQVSNCTFVENEAVNSPNSFGGAVAAGDVIFRECLFEGNVATADEAAAGGALFVSGDARVIDSTFRDNVSGRSGGAAALEAGSLAIVNSAFENNTTLDYGGGGAIALLGGVLDVADSEFIGNTGTDEGGAVRLASGVANLTRASFLRYAAPRGGAVFAADALCYVTDSTFTENHGCGGALWLQNSATLQGSRFERNFPDHVHGPYADLGGNTGLPYADLNIDGAVNVHDLLAYLDLWFTLDGTVTNLLGYLDCWFTGDPDACPATPGPCE
jgi:hypothetical protein